MLHAGISVPPGAPACHTLLASVPLQSNQLDCVAYIGCEKSKLYARVVNPAAAAGAATGGPDPAGTIWTVRSALGLPPYARPGASSAAIKNSFLIILKTP